MLSDLPSDVRYRLRAIFRRGLVEQELDEELRFHLERETQEYLRRGLGREEAERQARLAFGRMDDAKDASRDGRGTTTVSHLLGVARTLRHAARRILRAPWFGVTAVLTLALGIGATSAVFSVVDTVLLRPLPYPGSGRLVDLGHTLQLASVLRVEMSDAGFLFYRRENTVFSDVAVYQPRPVNLGGLEQDAGADRATALLVSASLFPVLQVTPLRGRLFSADDDRPGAAPVVILAERLWKQKFGGAPDIVGRFVPVDGLAHRVIGVMPERFRFPDAGADLWLPSGIDPARYESATFGFQAVARLRDGVTLARAESDLNRLLPLLPEAFPGRLTAGAITATRMRVVVRPLRDAVIGDAGRVLWIALGAIGFVLLAACGNLANLFLVRAEARSREVALRRALGAGWAASMTESMAEGLVVAGAGGVLGIGLAAVGVRAFQLFSGSGGWGQLPRLADVRVNAASVGFAAALTVLTALLVSLLPMLKSRVFSPNTQVAAGRGATAGRERHLVRYALVASQVAVALVLLAGTGVMARSFARLRDVPVGFDPAGVLTLRLALPASAYPAAADVTRFDLRALDALAASTGVETAAVASKLPLTTAGKADTAVFIEDKPLGMGKIPGLHQVVSVTPEYFGAMKVPVLAGTPFHRPDPARPVLEAMVSRAFAEHYWPGESAVGKRIRTAPAAPWSSVIGVVGDLHDTALEQAPDQLVYVPLIAVVGTEGGSYAPREVAFVIRARNPGQDPALLAGAARQVIQGIDPSVAVHALTPMGTIVASARARTAATLLLLGVASAAALALAGVGIFGVIAYGVSLRRREIGIRMALGAGPAGVRRMVTRQAVAVSAIGVVAGLAGAIALTRVLGALLFETRPIDPSTLTGAAVLLLVVAAAASWAPAARAARVDPASALRAD